MIYLSLSQIQALVNLSVAADSIEEAYRATSEEQITLPPVGHITFAEYNADCHIKYGHVHGDATFVIKVATGFPENTRHGLNTGNGVVLVMSAETGELLAVLHDEMLLTDVRTGIGGAIASRTLARKESRRVLVIGTGPQACQQIKAHAVLLPYPATFEIWGRDLRRATDAAQSLQPDINVTQVEDLREAVACADIVVTATGAQTPLVLSDWVQPGTHITAVGADAPGKQELDVDLVARADIRVADSLSQCTDHGELSHGSRAGLISAQGIVELGSVLADPTLGRSGSEQITIADLTGIAAQDIAMANSILTAWQARRD